MHYYNNNKKIFFFIILFLFFLNKKLIAIEKFEIIATVNNDAITHIDLLNEIEIIKLINSGKNLNNQNLKNIAIKTLIDEKIKLQEIIKEKITLENKILDNFLNQYLLENKISNNISNSKKIIIKEKILITTNWNNLIYKKYSWKISINMNEIDQKILNARKTIDDENKINDLKENLIRIEKNKKIQVYSNYHLNKIKNNSYIKIY